MKKPSQPDPFTVSAQAARDLLDRDITEGMQEILRTGKLPAVLAMLERERVGWESRVSDPDTAANPHKLAHTSGCLHAILSLQHRLRRNLGIAHSTAPTTPGD